MADLSRIHPEKVWGHAVSDYDVVRGVLQSYLAGEAVSRGTHRRALDALARLADGGDRNGRTG